MTAFSVRQDRTDSPMLAQDRLMLCMSALREIPSGLLVYRYDPPDRLYLAEFNPSAVRIFGRDFGPLIGKEFDHIWPEPYRSRVKGRYIETMVTQDPTTLRDVQYEHGSAVRVFNIRVFPFSHDWLGIMLEDVTDYWEEVERRRRAYVQIDKNIEHFATLVDELRNPTSVILHTAANCPAAPSSTIVKQAQRIEDIVSRLERGWIESEKVRAFLRRDMLED